MIVGGGGREHALAWKLAQSPAVETIICAPGNGGTALMPLTNLPIAVSDFAAIAGAAKEHAIDLIVVGPDNPLADGIVDYLHQFGLTVFGPTAAQAKLEASKRYAKEVMVELGLPTARFFAATNLEEAQDFVRQPQNEWARVVKADGLALGKGVFVCDDLTQVEAALVTVFGGGFGDAGNVVVLEEKLVGEELSLLCLCDGKDLVELACAQDHKRRFAGDTGPNTGGMGAYSPVPLYDRGDIRESINAQILAPLRSALKDGRLSFKGVLFIGVMVADGKPYILEFNARLGDPETQTVLVRLQSDLLPLLASCADDKYGSLADQELKWSDDKSVCIAVVAKDYPAKSSNGEAITLAGTSAGKSIVFHAGTKLADDGKLLTAGGRVFSAVGLGASFEDARVAALSAIATIEFDQMDYRNDIGWRTFTQCASK
jgi:phosphoribosylamine--glycine ligase